MISAIHKPAFVRVRLMFIFNRSTDGFSDRRFLAAFFLLLFAPIAPIGAGDPTVNGPIEVSLRSSKDAEAVVRANAEVPATRSDTITPQLAGIGAVRQISLDLDLSRGSPQNKPKGGGLDLNLAERLSIRFQGISELTGEYRVNADQTVSIPVVGRISVAGVDATQLEYVISDLASKIAAREIYATVEVSEYKPVFVSGSVVRSGLTPWRPGMSVIHAVAMSGGVPRGAESATAVEVEATRVNRATADLKRGLSTLSRLLAERGGADAIAIPQRLVDLVGKTDADNLINAQRTIFASRKATFKNQTETLERGIENTRSELTGLQQQNERLKLQLVQRRAYAVDVKALVERGVLTKTRGMEEHSRLSEIEERSTNSLLASSRVRGTVMSLSRELDNLLQERNAALDTEIARVQRDNALLEVELESAQTAIRRLTGVSTDKFETRLQTVEYEIVRRSAVGNQTLKVEPFADIIPGDLISVSIK
jgi:protein involved in polysaccharide export with SLBB domain